MEVTLSGMVMLVKPHPQNALVPMEMTPLPRLTLVKLGHNKNVQFPIEVTLLGMATLVKPDWAKA